MTLPQSWAKAPLGNLCEKLSDGSHNPPKARETGLPMLSARNINYRKITFDEFRLISPVEFAEEDRRTRVSSGDVLLTIVGAIGRTAVVPQGSPQFTLQRSVAVLKPRSSDPRYISYALEAPALQKYLQDNAKGTAQKGIYLKALAGVEIPVAPEAEQKRIADKLDTVLTRADAVNTRLARVAPLLKRFRQSVLAAATSGRLTEDWRGGRAVNETWRVIPLGKYVENHDGARVPISETLRTERRGAYPYYGASGVIDTIDGFTHEGKFVLIGEDGANLVTRSKPIAFIATGKIWVNNHAHVLKCKEGASDEYLAYYINSIDLTPYVSGSAQPKLNQKNLNTIPVPVPPTEEQTEIVRRVETLFAFADRLEARLAQAQTAATRLTPALLAKAFRGELVPQDPNDEPAAVLLRRLQAERASAPKASTGRGRKAAVQV